MRMYANEQVAVLEVLLKSGATYNLVFGYAGDINITRKKSDGTWAPAILLADLL